jgi:hypothetical protein
MCICIYMCINPCISRYVARMYLCEDNVFAAKAILLKHITALPVAVDTQADSGLDTGVDVDENSDMNATVARKVEMCTAMETSRDASMLIGNRASMELDGGVEVHADAASVWFPVDSILTKLLQTDHREAEQVWR